MDIIQYNAMHKFVGVLDNPPFFWFEYILRCYRNTKTTKTV